MDMTDTIVAKLFMDLLPIIEPSVSEGRIAVFTEHEIVFHCKLAIEAIDFSGCTVYHGYCSNQNGRKFHPFLVRHLNAPALVGRKGLS